MAGEMYSITQEGVDDEDNVWTTHAAVAKALGGKLKPFDKYQGPYIALGPDVRVGTPPYDMPVYTPGGVRLWISSEDGETGQVWNETAKRLSDPFPLYPEDLAAELAVEAARQVLNVG